jgi:hypothetical protein
MTNTISEEPKPELITGMPAHLRTDTEISQTTETQPMPQEDRAELGATATRQVVPSPELFPRIKLAKEQLTPQMLRKAGLATAKPPAARQPDALDNLASPWPLPHSQGPASRE